MFKSIDHSPRLAKLLASLSEFLARRRGLPVVIGIGLVIIGFILQMLEVYAPSPTLRLFGIIINNLGILIALIGLLLAPALGK